MQSYAAARSLFSFLGFCAWCLIVIGAIVAVVSATGVSQMIQQYGRMDEMAMLKILAALVPGLAISLVGLLKLALVQIGRASVDSAEYGQQMLKVARDQLEVSRQSLAGRRSPVPSFSEQAAEADETGGPSFADMRPTDAAIDDRNLSGEFEASEAVLPAPEQEETAPVTIEYQGEQIRRSAAGYLAHDVLFQTLDEAKQHVDAREQINRRLPNSFKI